MAGASASAKLAKYRSKRDFTRTAEPRGEARAEPGRRFVIQQHAARRMHYDFRLELDGVLMSWSVPKGPSLSPRDRRLAVRTEDHPLDYADFEGVIPAGEYGGGTVDIWDHGTYELLHERPNGTLTVILHGSRIEGEWALVPSRLDGQERNWLIVRAKKAGALGPARSYEPMRARAAKRVPAGPEWAFELAWTGVRALAPVEGAKGRFEHDRGDALEARTRHLLAQMPRALTTSECVLDGVICSLDEEGRPSRQALDAGSGTVVYMVVDVLDVEGESVIDRPWSERRALLEELLDDRVDDLRLSRAYDDGKQLRDAARGLGLGVIAKRRTSRYREGVASDDWRELAP
jgi:bifunctional non-homologous end joining protein LigD